MQQMPKGTMLAVALKEEQVRSRIDDWAKADNKLQEQLSIAAINGPSQCVVSGSTDTVKTLQNYLLEQGVTCRSLNTSHAFHSHMMEPILEAFTEQVQKINLKPPQIPYLSNVTGRWITADEATSPNYWARHLRYAVRFADGVQQLLKKPELILLEVGPGQTLSKLAKQQKETVDSLVLSSLPHPQGQKPVMNTATEAKQSLEFLLTTLGQLWLAGVQVAWNKFYAHEPRRRLSLPTYPFECQRYWADLPSTNNKKMGLFQDTQQFQQVTPLYSIPSNLQNTYMAPRHELERILVGILQENLGIAQIGIHDNFFELGGDSLLAIQIVSRLSQTFQVRLNQSQLIETPTVAKLASILQQTRTFSRKKSTLPLVEIQSGGSKRPLFCIHPAGGNVFCYLNLARYLDSEQPIYGLEDPNLYEEEKKINFQDKARQYIELIQTVQADGPYLLAGYSYGGNMAFEMAIQLKKQGHEVALLAMLDSFPPVSYENIFIDDTRLLAAIWQMTGLIFDKKQRSWYDELQKIDLDKQLEYVVEQVQMDESGIAVPESFLQTKLLQVAMNNFRELHNYVPQEIYSGQITYFWAQEKIPDSLNNLLNYQIPNDLLGDGWSKRTSKQIKNYYVPGHHFTMLNEPYLPVVAKRLRECLKQVETCVGS